MTQLAVFAIDQPALAIATETDFPRIAAALAAVGAALERWDIRPDRGDDLLQRYAGEIEALKLRGGYAAADVVQLSPDHPERAALRSKFIDEHTHSEDEVRFFAAGAGAFYIHLGDKVYQLICEQGDLLSVPANTPHWFDMGPRPDFTAIRIFTNPSGWVGHFTQSGLSSRFPRYGD